MFAAILCSPPEGWHVGLCRTFSPLLHVICPYHHLSRTSSNPHLQHANGTPAWNHIEKALWDQASIVSPGLPEMKPGVPLRLVESLGRAQPRVQVLS